MAEHNDLGKWGEDMAADYLEGRGYVLCERDWQLDNRDLDIVAYDPQRKMLVVVEVKTRTDDELQQPEEAVGRPKQRNLAIAANAYIKGNAIDDPVRFDIISVVGTMGHLEKLDHLVDAFNPMLIL